MSDEPDHVWIRPDRVAELADQLAGHAQTLRGAAGGVDRNVPDVPYDWFGLRALVVRLDEAREAFDLRLATFLDERAGAADVQVFEAVEADVWPEVLPLPRAAR
jgi:hypothetical protein